MSSCSQEQSLRRRRYNYSHFDRRLISAYITLVVDTRCFHHDSFSLSGGRQSSPSLLWRRHNAAPQTSSCRPSRLNMQIHQRYTIHTTDHHTRSLLTQHNNETILTRAFETSCVKPYNVTIELTISPLWV